MPLIKNLPLETVMAERSSRYFKSIIQQRAIPDLRDGLKPVQRRVIYAMWKAGNTVNKPYRKSAKAVGDVMGNFHPHGDSSIYEALIHMSQDWKMEDPLIDLHGNNGSIDEDPPAAMRYTEARLSKISNEMVRGINDDTVSWVLNFDDTEYEPTVLPSRFPNLLVNGGTGISAGYATNIPPHNLGEVINALIYLQHHPSATLDQLMQFIPAPDFPTGGVLEGREALKHAYQTGRGKVILRSKVQIKKLKGGKKQLYVSEIPYGVNKQALVTQIKKIQLHHKVNGIIKVQDQTDRSGLAIVVNLKRNADAKGVLNYLYKNTNLRIAYHFNMVVIDRMQPKQLGLKPILTSYLNFQRQIVANQTKYKLSKTHQHQEIVQGYLKALQDLDGVIHTIRNSNNRNNATQNLIHKFSFSVPQAHAITGLKLYRLTNTDASALQANNQVLTAKVNLYRNILHNPYQLDLVLEQDFLAIKKRYAHPRKTSIQDQVHHLHVSKQVVIPDEDVVALVSHDGYLKRSSYRSYQASQKEQNGLRPGDYPLFIQHLNTRDNFYLFTNRGRMIYRPVIMLKNAKWKATGQHISQQVNLLPHEQIINVQSFRKPFGTYLLTTNDGYIKQVKASQLKPKRDYRKHAFDVIKFKHLHARVTNIQYIPHTLPNLQVLLLTKFGMADRFSLSEVPVVGTNATGVKAMNLKLNDKIKTALIVDKNSLIGSLTANGTLHLFHAYSVTLSHRNRRGVNTLPANSNQLQLAISVNPLISAPLTIYTQRRQTAQIKPFRYHSQLLRSRGYSIMNTQKLGTPARISY